MFLREMPEPLLTQELYEPMKTIHGRFSISIVVVLRILINISRNVKYDSFCIPRKNILQVFQHVLHTEKRINRSAVVIHKI